MQKKLSPKGRAIAEALDDVLVIVFFALVGLMNNLYPWVQKEVSNEQNGETAQDRQ